MTRRRKIKAPPTPISPRKRLALPDEIRGITLINMIFYHFLWDLVFIAGIPISWYHGRGAYIWQQCICWTFIFLSGFCWSLGRHHTKRGLLVWLAGGLVTIVTLVFLPENKVVFGVLTLIGSCMLLMIPLNRILGKVSNLTGLMLLTVLSGLLFLLFRPVGGGHLANFAGVLKGERLFHGGPALPKGLYRGWFSAYLGFPPADFYSTDYFPLIPWFFLFTTGYLFHRLFAKLGCLRMDFMRKPLFPIFAAVGRRSLLIYMLHQPLLYGITLLIAQIMQYITS